MREELSLDVLEAFHNSLRGKYLLIPWPGKPGHSASGLLIEIAVLAGDMTAVGIEALRGSFVAPVVIAIVASPVGASHIDGGSGPGVEGSHCSIVDVGDVKGMSYWKENWRL
jgi:hypothetical protein